MSEFKLIPIAGTGNRVFFKELGEKKSKGGIVLTQAVDKRPTEGIVIAVSEKDANGKEPNVKVGDHIFFPEWAGMVEDNFEGQKFFVIKESELFAKLNK